jgi:hypothetical protein
MRKLALLLALAAPGMLAAQTFSLITGRVPVTSLDGLWRFHAGDNSAWASPSFDDSGWALIRGDRSWSTQGFANLDGFAWYRARIDIPAGQKDLALFIPSILTSYEVYADGRPLGGEGGMPPHAFPVSEFSPSAVYTLPGNATTTARTETVAIRVWHSPQWELLIGGGMYQAPLIGQTVLMEERKVARMDDLELSTASESVLATLEALAGLAALGFFWLRPREKEYLWFLIWMFASAALHVATRAARLEGTDVRAFDALQAVLQTTLLYAQIAFFYRLLSGRRGWLFWAAIGSVAGRLVIPLIVLAGFAIGAHLPQGTIVGWYLAEVLLSFAPALWVLPLLFQRTVNGFLDARLLLAPVLLLQFSAVMDPVLWISHFVFGWSPQSRSWFYELTTSPFIISVPDVCEGLFLVGMLAIFVHRFTRTSQHEEAQRRELESARAVQQVLIPEAIPQVPGYAIESVYKPASAVGGDFFQILPSASGGVLAVIGDVSGKGMPAAMTVSLLVGTVRTLVHYTQSPGEILAAMNQRMLSRSNGGFTTCLVLRADPDGALTVANAGHLAPYLDAEELQIESGLPLGLAAGTVYTDAKFQLEAGSQLTLMTDGVLEATNSAGELFGFDRTAAISTQPAEEIARSAQQFGQDDDITVLTLAFAPAAH